MAPLVPSAQQMTTCKGDTVYCLRPGTFKKRRGNGGSSDGVEERDTLPKHSSSSPNPAPEESSGHSVTSPGHSKPQPVPTSPAKAVSKPVETAKPTHKTAPQFTPKPVPHTKSSPHTTPKQSPRPSSHEDTSPTPTSATPKPIPTSLSLPRPSSVSPPLQGQPSGKNSTSSSSPPPQSLPISTHTRAIAAGVGSTLAVLLLIGLFLLLRQYCRRGGSKKHPNRTRNRKSKDEEAQAERAPGQDREAVTGAGIEMVRPTQAQWRDFGSQFSPSLEAQSQSQSQGDSADQEAGEDQAEGEGEAEVSGYSLRQPLVPERAISYFRLPDPVVGVDERAAAFRSSGEARVVYFAPSDDGEVVGRVVSLGDSCVIEMLVRMMEDDERRDDRDRIGVVQERREVDGVVVTVDDLGAMEVEAEESGGERRVDGGAGRSPHGGLGSWVENPHLDGHELDSEDEGDDCSFKSTRGSVGLSGDEETEGAGRGVRAAGGFEGVGSEGSGSDGSQSKDLKKGGDSGYEDGADSDSGDSGDGGFKSL